MTNNTDYRKLFCSPELERHSLSGFLIHPNIYVDVDLFIKDTDFTHQSHRIIYSVARNLRLSNQKFDAVILAEKIKEIGVTFKDGLDVFSYCEILFSSQISQEATIDSFKQLEKQRILRELCEQADKVKEAVIENREKDIDKVVSLVDGLYSSKLSLHNLKEEPQDLYDGLDEMVLESAKNPKEYPGLITGFKNWDEKFGGVYASNGIFVLAARMKVGKSVFLAQLARNMVVMNKDVVALYLDTEMTTTLQKRRLLSSLSGVKSFYLENGQWINNPNFKDRVEKNIINQQHPKGLIYHIRCAGMPVNEVLSIIRRFYYRYCAGKKKLLVIYDYIKLGVERVSSYRPETMAIGEIVDAFNNLSFTLGDEDIYVWSAAQANRENSGSDRQETDAIIFGSDRIAQYAAHVGLLQWKSLEDIADLGVESGSHEYIPLVSRFYGKESPANQDLVNIAPPGKKKKFKSNRLFYHMENFSFEERGTLKDWVHRAHNVYQLQKPDDFALKGNF